MTLDPAALTADLIRCPSVTPADAGVIAVLAAALAPLGFRSTTLVFESPGTAPTTNLWAVVGDAPGPTLAFAGHTDVVPAGDPATWSVDPFGGILRDGWVIGRGAVDMKGAIAAFAAAAGRFLVRQGAGFGGRIAFLISGDEEGPAINGTPKLLDWLAARSERIDACLVGEPTSGRQVGDTIKIGRRGSLTATITITGVAGHTAYPHLADNPIHRLVALLADLTSAPLDARTEHFDPSTLQIATVDVGNPANNVIPAAARAVINIRFNDRWTASSLETWLRQRCARAGGVLDLAVRVSGESFLTPPSAFAALVADAAAGVTGNWPSYNTGGGTSDARFIHPICPVAELGLVGKTMHQRDEAVAVDDLNRLADIYEAVLNRFFLAR